MWKIPTVHVIVVSVIPVFPSCLWVLFCNHLYQNLFYPKYECWIFPGLSITHFPFILFCLPVSLIYGHEFIFCVYEDGFHVPIFSLLPLWTQDFVYVHYSCNLDAFQVSQTEHPPNGASDLLPVFPYSAYCRSDHPPAARTWRSILSTSLTPRVHETTKSMEF